MFFLIGFGWHVAASFAFLVAILSPNWIAFQLTTSSDNTNVQRGIFYVCELLSKTSIYELIQCTSVIDVDPVNIQKETWKYKLGIASAALAISCAGLSLIVLWLSGINFNRRKRDSITQCFLSTICILLFVTFCTSVAIWILLIAEILSIGQKAETSIFRWPMWLAIGASGGFLMGFISMVLSFCRGLSCRRRRRDELYSPENHF
ncbi:unnamed protein product [Rotaria magnacalcarata]|uniref:Uncharacterized protein n=1 Tax=Rotaria magnacalcarata TaxID=392030 RepID=A0A816LFY5_9BILA|nr:unnamed protein product [Rotaria magnacalcarata]CAF5153782.1 unnamed protein product [Rotaria magnacalcarata]